MQLNKPYFLVAAWAKLFSTLWSKTFRLLWMQRSIREWKMRGQQSPRHNFSASSTVIPYCVGGTIPTT